MASFSVRRKTTSPRPSLLLLLLVFGALALYHLTPYWSPTVDFISSSIASRLQSAALSSTFCTKEIGKGICCELHLGAEPCLDECRNAYMDRETFQITKDYDECADRCLVMYEDACGTKEKVARGLNAKRIEMEVTSESKVRGPRRRNLHLT
ncbi:hypothetical protein EJ04DRAFT_237724 [Polyplosphaeria fusca]|uniref:Uncharacterized protein n=1 Tax=Polyplosphaeria fusca TaxID=682080 RepID=A0A9P4V8C6_9PLEO|nr:hypothetical protein EJ04DRAFT_237724 [Polyplosphaeria fusca]